MKHRIAYYVTALLTLPTAILLVTSTPVSAATQQAILQDYADSH